VTQLQTHKPEHVTIFANHTVINPLARRVTLARPQVQSNTSCDALPVKINFWQFVLAYSSTKLINGLFGYVTLFFRTTILCFHRLRFVARKKRKNGGKTKEKWLYNIDMLWGCHVLRQKECISQAINIILDWHWEVYICPQINIKVAMLHVIAGTDRRYNYSPTKTQSRC
jgi:hypothetical protein